MPTRPTEYSPEMAASICERVADGAPLYKLCEEDAFPARGTIYRWFAKYPEFRAMFELAKAEYADTEFDRLDEWMNKDPPKDERGRVDLGWVQQQRVKLEALRFRLRHLSPKRFSERVELTGAGGDPLLPAQPEMTPELLMEGARRIAFALRTAEHVMNSQTRALLLEHETVSASAPTHARSS